MTPAQRQDHITRIVTLAGMIALEAPARRNKNSYQAYVSWSLIEELRVELEAVGYDLKAARVRMKEIAQ